MKLHIYIVITPDRNPSTLLLLLYIYIYIYIYIPIYLSIYLSIARLLAQLDSSRCQMNWTVNTIKSQRAIWFDKTSQWNFREITGSQLILTVRSLFLEKTTAENELNGKDAPKCQCLQKPACNTEKNYEGKEDSRKIDNLKSWIIFLCEQEWCRRRKLSHNPGFHGEKVAKKYYLFTKLLWPLNLKPARKYHLQATPKYYLLHGPLREYEEKKKRE